jgi:hypothetical protein
MLASDFNLDGELENLILAVVWLLALLHSQGHKPTSCELARNVRFGLKCLPAGRPVARLYSNEQTIRSSASFYSGEVRKIISQVVE